MQWHAIATDFGQLAPISKSKNYVSVLLGIHFILFTGFYLIKAAHEHSRLSR